MKTKAVLVPLLILSFGAAGVFAQQPSQAERARRAEAEKKAQEAELKKDQLEKQKLEKELEKAKRQLDEAAKRVGELSTQLADKDVARLTQQEIALAFSKRPMIGIIFDTDANKKTDHLGLKLQGVTPGGPADEAGLKAGDILTRFNGHSLAADKSKLGPADKLREYLKNAKIGEKVHLSYLRGGTSHDVTVTLSSLAPMDLTFLKNLKIPKIPARPLPPNFAWYGTNLPPDWMDMEMVELNPGLGRYFDTSEGLLVVSAPKDSSLKLQAGDVILSIGGRRPDTPSQAFRILRSYDPGEKVALEVMRDHKRMTLHITVPAKSDRGFIYRQKTKSPRAFLVRPPAPPAAPAAPAAPRSRTTTSV